MKLGLVPVRLLRGVWLRGPGSKVKPPRSWNIVYALTSSRGRRASKPLRLMRLMEPPRPEAGRSGVGTLVISTREMLFIGTSRRSRERLLPEKAPATSPPSMVSPVLLPGKPRSEAVIGSDPEVSIETPGRKSRNSPMFSAPRSPNSSIATTLFRFGAARCSLADSACADISRSSTTVTRSKRTTPSPRTSSKSRLATPPAGTVTVSTAVAKPT